MTEHIIKQEILQQHRDVALYFNFYEDNKLHYYSGVTSNSLWIIEATIDIRDIDRMLESCMYLSELLDSAEVISFSNNLHQPIYVYEK